MSHSDELILHVLVTQRTLTFLKPLSFLDIHVLSMSFPCPFHVLSMVFPADFHMLPLGTQVASYNMTMSQLLRCSHWRQVLEMLRAMPQQSLQPDGVSYNVGISCLPWNHREGTTIRDTFGIIFSAIFFAGCWGKPSEKPQPKKKIIWLRSLAYGAQQCWTFV